MVDYTHVPEHCIVVRHINGSLNPSDALSKPMRIDVTCHFMRSRRDLIYPQLGTNGGDEDEILLDSCQWLGSSWLNTSTARDSSAPSSSVNVAQFGASLYVLWML